jgi:L-fuculose-phosphate aldolase
VAIKMTHGAVCIGRDMDEAFVVCHVLEKAYRIFIEAELLGGAKEIGSVEALIMR